MEQTQRIGKRSKVFRVNWDDVRLPKIEMIQGDGRTLNDCRREIISEAQVLIRHWRAIAASARGKTLKSFMEKKP